MTDITQRNKNTLCVTTRRSDSTISLNTATSTYKPSKKQKRSRQTQPQSYIPIRRQRRVRGRPPLLSILLLLSLLIHALILPIRAEEYADDEDDYLSNNVYQTYDDDTTTSSYYNYVPVTSSPTPYPTPPPTPSPTRHPSPPPTPYPTRLPARTPTPQPSSRPSWSNAAFYETENDDGYTAQAQSEKIYFSSMSDVILCLMCTFFWVLWLVGTIFPTRIMHLYRKEGIVVKGHVVESYVSTNAEDMELEMQMQMQEMMQEQNMGGEAEAGEGQIPDMDGLGDMGLDAMGMMPTPVSSGADDDIRVSSPMGGPTVSNEGGDLPTYHAIVSYVVPGRVASGRRKKKNLMGSGRNINIMGLPSVNENYVLHRDGQKPIKTDFTRSRPATASQLVEAQAQSTNASYYDHDSVIPPILARPPLTPPRSRTLPSMPTTPVSPVSTGAVAHLEEYENDIHTGEAEAAVGDARDRDHARKGKMISGPTNRRESLFDSTKSFDTEGGSTEWKDNDKGYYKYNLHDDSDYETPMGDDEYEEDPEYIGNPFYHFGFFSSPVKKVVPSEPVRVKKRFETHELLDPGFSEVRIIVLPGNPGSGILKSDFEQELDYNTISKAGSGIQMSNFSIGAIGVVLAAVSVIGTVHGALTLPYSERVYGWAIVSFSLTIMWPLAMYTYKTVNTLRLFMMNKIINLEPCGDTSIYEGLNKLHQSKMGACSDKSDNGGGNEYVLMLGKKSESRRGVWNYDEGSMISSLSGGDGLVGFRRIV